MSIFEEKPTEVPTEEAVATEQTTNESQPKESFLSKLVEERGENWKDPEVLAKGKLEADTHIKGLEEQLAELRGELDKQDYSAQLLKQLQGKAPESTSESPVSPNKNTEGGTTDGHTSQDVSEDNLQSLVEKALTEREQKATVEQNVSLVEQTLTDKYGTEAQVVVQKKAEELGLSIQRMQDLAAESPSAFMALVGEPAPTPRNMTQGSVRTESVGLKSNERNWDYYQSLRRSNRTEYFSPKIQRQIMEDKKRLGSKFGN